MGKAEKYQRALKKLEKEDPNYLRTIKEEAKEEGNDVHEVAWGLDDEDWKKIRIFGKFLKIFYDATLWFWVLIMSLANFFFFFLGAHVNL